MMPAGQSSDNIEGSDPDGLRFTNRTLRSTAFVAGFIVLMLLSYRQAWAVAPFLIGVALAAALLLGLEGFVRTFFSTEAVAKARKKRGDRKWALMAFALVKYPLVALLLWALVRMWSSDTRRLMVFIAGFMLLQVIIALRALGRLISDRRDS